jgi:uncharacterized membrane protein YbaN (DUF454 family)
MPPAIRTLWWRALALASLLLALVGLILPLVPTVPFVLVSAWAAGHGWPRLETWLLEHAHLGPPLRRWRQHRAVPRRAKWAASVAMTGSAVMIVLLPQPTWLKVAIVATMAVVAAWLWRRPEA